MRSLQKLTIPKYWFSRVNLGVFQSDSEDLRYIATMSIYGRWSIWAMTAAQLVYRPVFAVETYVVWVLVQIALVTFNALLHFRLKTNRPLSWTYVFGLSALDIAAISGAVAVHGGFGSFIFVIYYPALALFAVMFPSLGLSMAWTTLTALIYLVICLTAGSGLDFESRDEKAVFAQIVCMYGVVVGVNLVTMHERFRRRLAVARHEGLQNERIEFSQRVHDTIAQSAYMLRLGIDNAIELAGNSNIELVKSLGATSELSKSTLWELRRPIDVGQLFEGKPLGQMLESHVHNFAIITSIPTTFNLTGSEPSLAIECRSRLFSIAHNALANAFRHAGATDVTVKLEFGTSIIRLSVIDDGLGLPDDYATRGRGFSNMRTDVERLGGSFLVESGGSGGGTMISCAIPAIGQNHR